MSSATKVTCDSCGKVRDNDGGHLNYEIGWYILSTQWAGEWGNTRKDFCSDRCLYEWVRQHSPVGAT